MIDDVDVDADQDGAGDLSIDPASQVLQIEADEDGGVTITLGQPEQPQIEDTPSNHDDNLAETISEADLGLIADRLIRQIEADDESRQGWLGIRAGGIEKLGFMVDKPDASSSAPVAGISRVRDPILGESVLRFQANASGELLPTDGPVKVRNDQVVQQPTVPLTQANAAAPQQTPPGLGPAPAAPPPAPMPPTITSPSTDDLADVLEKDFNHYLTSVETSYVPSTKKMLLWVGLGGMEFKKVYNHPLRRRPVSEWADAKDIIVSNDAVDIESAGRVTQRVKMRPAVLKRMQLANIYRNVDLGASVTTDNDINAVDMATDAQQGITRSSSYEDDDEPRTIYESYCELDIPGYEHTEDGVATGLPLPYKVTIDKETREILEVRRNWKEGDPDQNAKQVFVPFEFVPGIGFYSMGLVNILSNISDAATAALRMALDASMLASFPGGLIMQEGTRQEKLNFTVGVGEFAQVKSGMDDIRKAVMPFPYKGPDGSLMELKQDVVGSGQRVAGTADMQVGEGRQDAPVGTTLALIEQATKIIDSVHKGLHAAQAREFELLVDLFRDDPESFWRNNKRNKRSATPWDVQTFLAALEDYDLVPQADPNTSSHMQRMGKVQLVVQLAQMAPPGLFNLVDIANWVMREAKISNGESLVNQAWQLPQGGPQQDPAKMMSAQAQQMNAQANLQKIHLTAQTSQAQNQTDLQIQQMESQDNQRQMANQAADRASKERLAQMDMHKDAMQHQSEQQATTARQVIGHVADHLNQQRDQQHEAAMQGRDHAAQAGLAAHSGMLDVLQLHAQQQHAFRVQAMDNQARLDQIKAQPKPKGLAG